ncbi:hypothetical protein BDN72DRAFT_900159 [Pluteus cervinus]|uniref:Uncharacterized protein n=1 Tax=Pluteus cervinus TaxID=181527 RepID=A0ACD3AK30_9AGAR|nr:hypothetical protein BDN72DRAFT_900159 [Pluteus cervinus]
MEPPASSQPSSPPQHEHTQFSSSPPTGTRAETLRQPTQEYLALSETPSESLIDPTSSRKLLILDLNGTLVYRSPHRSLRNRRRTHGQAASNEPPEDPYQNPTAPRPLRPVHPRPFIPPFVRFLFHEHTKAWLDTMVWSSAQPHSVGDMVDKSFGERRDELLAVWARDTMGLSDHEYYQKTQTTKDLATPWSQLPPYSLSTGEEGQHSATSTLLLDDSPRKAYLQPWNHLCIHEYVEHMRKADLDLAMREAAEPPPSHQPQNSESSGSTDQIYDGQATGEVKKKRKRAKKKKEKVTAPPTDHQYDPTLLAIVGILDTIRCESNVAGWLRSGGLWAGAGKGENETVVMVEDANVGVVAPDHEETTVEDQPHAEEARIHTEESSPKRRRVVDISMADSPQVAEADDVPTTDPSPFENQEATDNAVLEKPHLWFQDPDNVHYWVDRGLKALKELEIEVQHGVEVDGLENPHLSH